MKVTFVKKILADGSPCQKCGDVTAKLEAAGQMQYIDKVVIADERDANSEGMQLAAKYNVKRAPFFIVERPNIVEQPKVDQPGQETKIYTIYFQFVKEIIEPILQKKPVD